MKSSALQQKFFGWRLFYFTAFLGAGFSRGTLAREVTSGLAAPDGYSWKTHVSESQITATLVSKNNFSTTIQYSWELPAIRRSYEMREDEKLKIIGVKPGRHIWAPHPAENTTIEERFLDALRLSGYKIPSIRYLVIENGVLSFSTIYDFLNLLENKTPELTINQFVSKTLVNVQKSREAIITKMFDTNSWPKTTYLLSAVAEMFDFVEPMLSTSSSAPYVTAFNLLAQRQFLKHGDHFLDVLEATSRIQKFFPLTWHQAHPEISTDLKLAILSLVTHNHSCENILVATVALQSGVRTAWKVMSQINDLYQNERNYIESQVSSRVRTQAEFNSFMPVSNVSFLNDNRLNEFSFQLKHRGSIYWISSAKTYHLYGAFILASRLLEARVNPEVVSHVVPLTGRMYKKIRKADLNQEGAWISQTYRDGAKLAVYLNLQGWQ